MGVSGAVLEALFAIWNHLPRLLDVVLVFFRRLGLLVGALLAVWGRLRCLLGRLGTPLGVPGVLETFTRRCPPLDPP